MLEVIICHQPYLLAASADISYHQLINVDYFQKVSLLINFEQTKALITLFTAQGLVPLVSIQSCTTPPIHIIQHKPAISYHALLVFETLPHNCTVHQKTPIHSQSLIFFSLKFISINISSIGLCLVHFDIASPYP